MFTQLRAQALTFWQRQSRGQRLVLAGLVLAAVAALAVFTRWAGTPTYAVAFSGLDEADAGQIVEKLAADGIDYQVRNNTTILVPSAAVYEVRLSMARQGLPQGGNVGYELFSGSSTLGMTDFTQRVNYQRALEGELERTIGSLKAVEAVRVHIVTPEKSLLAGDQAPATASVTLSLGRQQSLDAGQIRSITHLVASAVEGLRPENVVVVDVDGNLLANGNPSEAGAPGQATDSRRAAEAAFAAAIETKVRNLLDLVLGPNKAAVKASVVVDWTQREITSQTYDPVGTLRSSQTLTETYTGDAAGAAGIPGAGSNLPPLAAGQTITGTQGAAYLRQEVTTNFEVSEQQSREVVAPGQVERLSLSVLVDSAVVSGTQQLETLRTAVAAAAGIDPDRGDLLAVEMMSFERSHLSQQAAEMAETAQTRLYVQIGVGVAAFLALLVLLWYVQRLLSNLRLASAEAWTPVLMPAGALQPAVAAPALAAAPVPATPLAAPPLGAGIAPAAVPAPALLPVRPAGPSPEEEVLQRAMSKLAEDNPVTIAEVIHLWLTEERG
jgi:flagellar M-ring protein FliF